MNIFDYAEKVSMENAISENPSENVEIGSGYEEEVLPKPDMGPFDVNIENSSLTPSFNLAATGLPIQGEAYTNIGHRGFVPSFEETGFNANIPIGNSGVNVQAGASMDSPMGTAGNLGLTYQAGLLGGEFNAGARAHTNKVSNMLDNITAGFSWTKRF